MIVDIQEMFNAAYIGIAKQGWKQAVDENDNCLYRTPDGLKCAIGHCMTDEEASLFTESSNSSEVLMTLVPDVDFHVIKFAHNLQWMHDISEDENTMRNNLAIIAHEYDLTIPKI